MKIKQYQVDAFASRVFEGNPAAVCPLDEWLPDSLMQAIAMENNLSETAFFVPEGEGYRLRWFTPMAEVDLCGHATLASAHLILNMLGLKTDRVDFETRSGRLTVTRGGEMLSMDFPARSPQPVATPEAMVAGLGAKPVEVLANGDFIVVFDDEATVRAMTPDLSRLGELDLRGVCVTAPSREYDFVSRFFAPKVGVPEDPVTGSAHCKLVPYWAKRLGKTEMIARQVSRRGGNVHCKLAKDRVMLSGTAVCFMEAWIEIGD